MSTNPATLHDVQPDGFFTRGLAESDPQVFSGLTREIDRERHQIELIACIREYCLESSPRSAGLGLHQ